MGRGTIGVTAGGLTIAGRRGRAGRCHEGVAGYSGGGLVMRQGVGGGVRDAGHGDERARAG